MRQRDMLEKLVQDKKKRSVAKFPVGVCTIVTAALAVTWHFSVLTQGQAIIAASVVGLVLLLSTAMKGNKSRPVDQRIFISDPSVQSDDPPRELVERRTPSSTHKVAQRMRELSPLQSNNSSRFSVASMQASRITHSTEKDSRPVSVHMTGGNAWTNARSLVDFSASMVHTKEDPSDSYSGEQAEPAASSILFWHRDESYDSPQKSTPQRNLWSGDETGRSGSAPNPNKTMSFSTSPVTYSGTMRRTGRYYASPPESPFTNGGDASGSAGKRRGGQTAKPITKECLKELGLDMVDDEYIINVKRILGSYLADSVYRFDVLVSMITDQLLGANKITSAQKNTVKGLLGHTIEQDPSPQIGSNELSEVSLSAILNFCRRADVKDSLIVCDKSSGIVSDLTTEYDALLCLFRISGDRFGSHHANISSHAQFSAPSMSQQTNLPPTTSLLYPNNAASQSATGFYSSLYNKPNVTLAANQAAPQLMGSPILSMGDKDANHRCTSFIISRAHELATDDHFGKFSWKPSGRAPVRQRNGMLSYDVEDAEIVMAVFLHFCDTNFSLLVASEEHRFSSLRFFDASNGIPVRLPAGKANICIFRKSYDPVQFSIATQDENADKMTELAVHGGRQNVFECILLFLLLLRKNDASFSGNPRVRGVMDDLFSGHSESTILSSYRYRKY